MRPLIFFIWMLGGISCIKDNSAPETINSASLQWTIAKVEGPDSGKINDSIPITVYWPFSTGCDALDRFEQTQQDNEIDIRAFGHTNYGFCTEMPGIGAKIFNFYTPTPGRYKLRFLNPDKSYVMHSVTVN